jgi:hypothetical protein
MSSLQLQQVRIAACLSGLSEIAFDKPNKLILFQSIRNDSTLTSPFRKRKLDTMEIDEEPSKSSSKTRYDVYYEEASVRTTLERIEQVKISIMRRNVDMDSLKDLFQNAFTNTLNERYSQKRMKNLSSARVLTKYEGSTKQQKEVTTPTLRKDDEEDEVEDAIFNQHQLTKISKLELNLPSLGIKNDSISRLKKKRMNRLQRPRNGSITRMKKRQGNKVVSSMFDIRDDIDCLSVGQDLSSLRIE